MKERGRHTKTGTTYIISACLLGIPCRWNGKASTDPSVINRFKSGRAIAVCPEIMAGLPTPRPACEITGGDGFDVLRGKAKVIDKRGRNYTAKFVRGARRSALVARQVGVTVAYLKSGSPSCGARIIYNGTFTGNKRKGKGVFAALLQQNGIRIIEQQ